MVEDIVWFIDFDLRVEYGNDYDGGLVNLFQTLVNSTKGDAPMFTPNPYSLVAVQVGVHPKVGGGQQPVYTLVFFEDARKVPIQRYPYDATVQGFGLMEERGGKLFYDFNGRSINVKDIEKPAENLLMVTLPKGLDEMFQKGAKFFRDRDEDDRDRTILVSSVVSNAVQHYGQNAVMDYLKAHLPRLLRVQSDLIIHPDRTPTYKTLGDVATEYENGIPVKIGLSGLDQSIMVRK